MLKAASRILGAALAAALILFAAHAEAAMVSGVYTSFAGKPLADHQLHFENRISGDIYLTHTGDDGSFASDLPPGTYDLRAERGLVVRPGIRVDGPEEQNVGRVSDGAPFDVRRPFEREGINRPLLETEAPATAHLEKQHLAPAPASSAAEPSSVASPNAAH
jgi:hypothetical protein